MNLYSGRIGRLMFILGYALFLVLAYGMAYLVRNNGGQFGITAFIFGLIATRLVFSLLIRRLHDLNLSGWLSLLIVVPFINILLMLTLVVWPSR